MDPWWEDPLLSYFRGVASDADREAAAERYIAWRQTPPRAISGGALDRYVRGSVRKERIVLWRRWEKRRVDLDALSLSALARSSLDEEAIDLRASFAKLPAREAIALWLWATGHSSEEIAEGLSRNAGAAVRADHARQIVKRALVRLRDLREADR